MSTMADTRNLASQNEDMVYPGEVSGASAARSWYAVYTIVRHEKTVDSLLSSKKIETFLPLREVMTQWKDRRKKLQLPLFPGYIFVRIFEKDAQSVLNILNTRGVVRILSSNGSYERVSAHQIDSIRCLVDTNVEYDPYKYLVKGKEVVVVNGPLSGVSGKIVERKGQNRLIVSIDIIKRSVAVKVDPADIELV
ncbi:MAG: UpxY family transcription antiterminator [Deltaproteobacteria bacterium]